MVTGVAWYNGDYDSSAQYGVNIAIVLRAAANAPVGATAPGSPGLCGHMLYALPRLRNLVYCPPTTGVNFVRFERSSTDYLSVTEVEVFRGGVWQR